MERVAWAINGVRLYTPWVSNCFPQAVAAHRLLRRHGVSSTLYLGAMRNAGSGVASATESRVAAHAWVRSGEHFVTGGAERELYTPILWFTDGLVAVDSMSDTGVCDEA